MTESPPVQPGSPDSSPAAADPGEGVEPTAGFGEEVDPDVLPPEERDDTDDSGGDVTEAVRERPDPPFRTPDVG